MTYPTSPSILKLDRKKNSYLILTKWEAEKCDLRDAYIIRASFSFGEHKFTTRKFIFTYDLERAKYPIQYLARFIDVMIEEILKIEDDIKSTYGYEHNEILNKKVLQELKERKINPSKTLRNSE